ncbi:hypothetical protein [Paraburkholderia sp. A1RO-5L]|uniref:hypothetical protein n=1 Tax=Paraburkholderia sp. A1RO-5L TaxID=3028370 RepID=UPI003B7B124B
MNALYATNTNVSNLAGNVTTINGQITSINGQITNINGKLNDAVLYDSSAHNSSAHTSPVALHNVEWHAEHRCAVTLAARAVALHNDWRTHGDAGR